MNKLFNTILSDVKKNKSIYISLIIALVISLIFGILFITILSIEDKELVEISINEYTYTIKNGNYIALNALKNNILNNNIYSFIIWILGLSIIGIPLIICMLFYKGFSLSFTVTSLIYTMKAKGILFGFIYIFPHLIINLILYFILSCYSFNLSIKMFKLIFNNDKSSNKVNIKHYLKKYLFILIISIILFSITAIYETYVIPYLIKLLNY